MCFPELTTPPLLCLKSFSRVTSLGHRARSNQSHAASLGALLLSTPGRGLPQHFEFRLVSFDRARNSLDPLFEPQHALASAASQLDDVLAMWTLKSDSWEIAANERRVVLFCWFHHSTTDRLMDGMCKLLPLFSPLFCTQGCQKLSQTHDVLQVGSLSFCERCSFGL